MSNTGAGRHCDERRITHQHRARRCRDNHTGSMLRAAPLLLAAVVSLDFAYQSSVDAFLPALLLEVYSLGVPGLVYNV